MTGLPVMPWSANHTNSGNMGKNLVRSYDEVVEQLTKAGDAIETGSLFPDMTYEQGIIDMYNWLVGATEDAPLQ